MSDEFNSLFSLGDQLCDTCDRMIELMRQNDALALMYAGVFQNFKPDIQCGKK